MSAAQRFIDALPPNSKVRKLGKNWTACCPAHDDKSPSLNIAEADSGDLLLHCFGGCSYQEVMQAAGLNQADGFAKSLTRADAIEYQRRTILSAKQNAEMILQVAAGLAEQGQVLTDSQITEAADANHVIEQANAELEKLEQLSKPALQAIPLDDVMQALPEEVRHAVDPWFPKRHVTLFGGHGGMGKSMLALTLSAHVAAGVPFAGLPVEQSRVLFVSLEDEASIVRLRLRRVMEHYSLSTDSVLTNLVLLDGTRSDAALIQEGQGYGERAMLTPVYGEVQQAAAGCGMVVIDNASDAFDANENSRRDVRFFVRALAAMARANNAAIVLLAHIDKLAARNGGSGNDYSGSTAWHNSARSRIALMADPNYQDDGINPVPLIVEHQKANLGKKAKPARMEFAEGGVLVPLTGEAGSDISREMWDQSEMMRLLEVAIKDGIRVPGAFKPGNGSATQVLQTLQEYPASFKGKQGRTRANAALVALQRAKRIEVEAYQDGNRNSKTRVVLTQTQTNQADDVA